MRIGLHAILCWSGVLCGGIAVGRHFGIFDGIAAGLALYAVMNPATR